MVAHEYAHAEAAYRQGDNTAYMLGRLTLNPVKHIDPFMTVLLPLMLWFASNGTYTFGGAKPVPVNPRDRKSTRLNSSHGYISYAVFCLKKKKHHKCTNTS